MRVVIQMVVEQQNQTLFKKDIAYIERQALSLETMGLTLNESKLITSNIQTSLVEVQASVYVAEQRPCPC